VINDNAHPGVKLLKLSGLLPALVVETMAEDCPDKYLRVRAEAIEQYPAALAESIMQVSDANVPLANAEQARFIAFRPRFGHEEHLAVVIGNPASIDAPFVRVHSSCVTGDVFGSLRCDCGSQLHKALEMMKAQGAGVMLYLSQEGRGIGIANKLRAYNLQDAGLDTVEANLALGFEADERNFAIAAGILKHLGIARVTLLTNNPAKVESLAQYGIEVSKREAVIIPANIHNKQYLETKADKMRHTF
jgi:GTP cyclohydrolase II